jgi:hypothetical protein
MSKTLNESALQSELAGSAFFQPAPLNAENPSAPPPPELAPVGSPSTTPPPPPEPKPTPVEEHQPTAAPTSGPVAVRQPVRTPVRSIAKRTITRYAFELYRDQVDTLQRYRVEELSAGENGSMSQMVRDALDAYIAEREGRR